MCSLGAIEARQRLVDLFKFLMDHPQPGLSVADQIGEAQKQATDPYVGVPRGIR